MQLRTPLIFFCFVFIFFPIFSLAFQFTRPLSVGSVGQDVLELQKFLNKDFQTRVADSGPGSPGNETTYFGALTKLAAASFQDKYKNEVLLPIGLSSPTGFVGPQTIRKLNNLQTTGVNFDTQSLTVDEEVPKETFLSVPTINDPETLISNLFSVPPEILSLSKYEVMRGENVVVSGNSFRKDSNTIHFSGVNNVVSGIKSEDGSSLVFTVPGWLPDGSYNLWITNVGGSSYNSSFGEYFKVSSEPKNLPKIFSIEPSAVKVTSSQDIIIRGENFSARNDIYSNIGEIKGAVSDDGRTIRVSLGGFSQFSQIRNVQISQTIGNYSTTISLQVRNEVGLSQESKTILIEF